MLNIEISDRMLNVEYMYGLLEDVLALDKYVSLDVVCHFPLNMLIKNPELLNEKECRFAMNPATHVDFLLFNRISKKPVLVIETDGYEYHKENNVQASRDRQKDHILELYHILLLRFKTNGSQEREKIIEMLYIYICTEYEHLELEIIKGIYFDED